MSTFVRLASLMAPFQRWIALAAVLGFLTIASSVALMATSAYLISKSALVAEVATLSLAITSVRLFAISRAALRYAERLVSHRATFRILAQLRVRFYEAIEPLAPARLAGHRSGDLLARAVADIEVLENFYIRVLAPPFAAALVTALVCAFFGVFNWTLALVLLSFLSLTGVALPLTMRWLGRRSAGDLIAARGELGALLVDEIQGLGDLLVFDALREHRARVLGAASALDRAEGRMATLRGTSNACTVLLSSLAGLSVLALGTALVSGAELNPVYLASLPLAAVASFEALQPLSLALQQLEANHAAGRRLFELADAPPPVREPAVPAPEPADFCIELCDVCFGYDGAAAPALEGASFVVPAGSRVALVGPSGAGKSTIVNLLLRFWDYDAGRIAIGGRDLRDYRSDDVRAMLGVVPQTVYVFNSTVRDNLLLANADASDGEIVAACRQALLHDFIERLPEGYDTLVGENGARLSGGERQRLAIARVILKGAPIVVLDEPTAHLDVRTERELMRSLEPFLSGRTVLVISHRPVPRDGVDQVIALERGHVRYETRVAV